MPDEIPDFPADGLLQTLSAALTRIIRSYGEFSSRLSPDNAKDFIVHHNACKAALGHLGALVRLIEKHRKQDYGTNGNEEIETLVLQARTILLTTENNDEPENQL